MTTTPLWFELGEETLWRSVAVALEESKDFRFSDEELDPIPYMAGCHLAACVEQSIDANRQGKHSTAICLIRQCVESLTFLEIGYQQGPFAERWLGAWAKGKKSHGELRRELEKHIWPNYGKGLWDEPWSDFFGNLARAVQPYAHYTPELQGWQLATIRNMQGMRSLVAIGPGTYDELKASRITLLHVLVGWTLSRILVAAPMSSGLRGEEDRVQRLGRALGDSKLLFRAEDWGVQLIPHMFFKAGHDWRDP